MKKSITAEMFSWNRVHILRDRNTDLEEIAFINTYAYVFSPSAQ